MHLLLALLLALSGLARAETPTNPHPFIFIGVDGMEWSVIEKLQAKGDLPSIAALRARGVSAKLATDYGAASPVVWTTVATGMNKEVHGITDFAITTATGTSPVTSTLRKVPAIWNMASGAGKRVLVLGWWGSWPAEKVNGVVVTDRAVKAVENRVSPPEYETIFLQETKRINADRTIFPLDEDAGSEDRMVTYLAERYPMRKFDLTMAYLHGIDLVSHKYWKYWEPSAFGSVDAAGQAAHGDKIAGKYRAIDAAIGRIVKGAPADVNIVVASDHGFGPLSEEFVKVSLDLDAVLEAVGLLVRKGTGVDQAASKVFVSDAAYFVMEKTVRFGTGVSPEGQAAVRADVAAKLAKVTYETGKPVFRLRDAKPYEKAKGDFVVETLQDGAAKVIKNGSTVIAGAVKEIVAHSGGHHWLPPGVFMAAGPDIDPKADLTGIRIHDMTPTLLLGMGLPIASDFNGKPYAQLYNAAHRAAYPQTTIASYGKTGEGSSTSSNLDEEMLEQLRALGYIK